MTRRNFSPRVSTAGVRLAFAGAAFAGAVAGVTLLVACGGGNVEPECTEDTATSTTSVVLEDDTYVPNCIKVDAGDSITFTNHDAHAHTVTAADDSFDSGGLDTDDTFTQQFADAGTVDIHCNIHLSMEATVFVVGGGG